MECSGRAESPPSPQAPRQTTEGAPGRSGQDPPCGGSGLTGANGERTTRSSPRIWSITCRRRILNPSEDPGNARTISKDGVTTRPIRFVISHSCRGCRTRRHSHPSIPLNHDGCLQGLLNGPRNWHVRGFIPSRARSATRRWHFTERYDYSVFIPNRAMSARSSSGDGGWSRFHNSWSPAK